MTRLFCDRCGKETELLHHLDNDNFAFYQAPVKIQVCHSCYDNLSRLVTELLSKKKEVKE